MLRTFLSTLHRKDLVLQSNRRGKAAKKKFLVNYKKSLN